MSIFGKKMKPGEQRQKELDKQFAKNEKSRKALETRQKKIMDCRAVLEECRTSFQKSILVENSRAAEMRRRGFPCNEQRARVREAAIGILVVDQALFELKSITSESELNGAMNKMGMALKQLRRLDNSSTAISGATKKTLMKWYPYPLEENEGDKSVYTQLEVPAEIRDKIDADFVGNLMDGDSFELCLMKANKDPREDVMERSSNDLLFDSISSMLPDEDTREAERKAMNDRFGDQF